MDASSAPTMALRVFSSSPSSSSSSSASFKPNKSLPFKFTNFRPPPQPTLFKSLKCIQTPPSSNPNPLKHPPPPPPSPAPPSPSHPLTVKTDDLSSLNVGLPAAQRSRVNTWHNVQVSMQKKTKALVAQRQGTPPLEPFPSLVVTADGFRAKGSFAEAQARYLFPDESKVEELVNVLKEKKIGVVAHFYMDPEVQGILTAAQKHWPHIHVSDSLVMADSAMTMAKAGCEYITVLVVDFM